MQKNTVLWIIFETQRGKMGPKLAPCWGCKSAYFEAQVGFMLAYAGGEKMQKNIVF